MEAAAGRGLGLHGCRGRPSWHTQAFSDQVGGPEGSKATESGEGW